jgi:integrase
MRHEHIENGWWIMPGEASATWPGTKNGQTHRVWLPNAALAVIEELNDKAEGFVLAGTCGRPISGSLLAMAMRTICSQLKVRDKVTPYDLRRTHGTMITSLGFGRDAMNRVQNHKEGGIASVYGRHRYAKEIQHVMETVAAHTISLVQGMAADKVVPIRQ